MKLPPFEVHRPTSVEDASRLLTELGDDAVAMSGGTELLLAMKLGLASYGHVVDLKRVGALRSLEVSGDVLSVGGGVTHRELETSPLVRSLFPALSSMLADVANLRVRSVGTLGGNLCFADPHSDPATFLAAMGAVAVLGSGASSRRVPVEGFSVGPYETVLAPGELLTGVELRLPGPGTGVSHVRMKTHERPTVTVTSRVEVAGGVVTSARLAVGSVCSVPVVTDTASSLLGSAREDWEERVARCSAATAEAVEPVADADGAVGYKSALVEVLARRGLHRALELAAGSAGAGGVAP
ncbi:MAG: FAD binding domain-containing protein [Actinomycetota bacterium]|nr:FAD binding domain-containing protein [Actinomycetota bacterium]